jgi:hypothetical protein
MIAQRLVKFVSEFLQRRAMQRATKKEFIHIQKLLSYGTNVKVKLADNVDAEELSLLLAMFGFEVCVTETTPFETRRGILTIPPKPKRIMEVRWLL